MILSLCYRIAWLLLLCCNSLTVWSASVFMEIHLLDEHQQRVDTLTAKQSQRVSLAVDIYTDSWFTQAPVIAAFEIPGVVSLSLEPFGVNFTEQRLDKTYAAQRREFTLFPQRQGQIIVPALTATVTVADSAGKPSAPQVLRSAPLAFQVEAIGPDLLANTLVAEGVAITESWQPDLQALRAGDAVQRTVTVAAEGSLGMLIPPLQWPAVRGVQQQAQQPRTEDQTARGEFRGKRIEVRSYLMEKNGEFTLPALQIQWWNTQTQTLEVSTLPERVLTVSGGEELSSTFWGAALSLDWFDWRLIGKWLLIVITVIVVVCVTGLALWWLPQRVRRGWIGFRQADLARRRALVPLNPRQS